MKIKVKKFPRKLKEKKILNENPKSQLMDSPVETVKKAEKLKNEKKMSMKERHYIIIIITVIIRLGKNINTLHLDLLTYIFPRAFFYYFIPLRKVGKHNVLDGKNIVNIIIGLMLSR